MLTTSCTTSGYTVIESMVVVAIIGILTAIAGPRLMGAIQDLRIRAAAEGLREGLETARVEAIKRNEPVTIAFGSLPRAGWRVAKLSEPDNVLQERKPEEAGHNTVVAPQPAGANQVTFDPYGRILAVAGVPLLESMDIGSASAISDHHARLRVQLSSGGVARLCVLDAPPASPTAC